MIRRVSKGCVRALGVVAGVLALGVLPGEADAQTIEGVLLDVVNNRPIDLGLIIMFTEDGDSVALDVSDPEGRFTLTSPEAGTFYLLASAFGYRETPAGIFDLADDGRMTIEFRIRPRPMELDDIVVGLNRPVMQHHLVRNGFVRRFERGLGHFITPGDIERSAARSATDVMRGINGVFIQPGVGQFSAVGERIMLRDQGGGLCQPSLYLDGVRMNLAPGERFDNFLPLSSLDALEIYRRPAEVPPEYSASRPGDNAMGGACGVIVAWTRR